MRQGESKFPMYWCTLSGFSFLHRVYYLYLKKKAQLLGQKHSLAGKAHLHCQLTFSEGFSCLTFTTPITETSKRNFLFAVCDSPTFPATLPPFLTTLAPKSHGKSGKFLSIAKSLQWGHGEVQRWRDSPLLFPFLNSAWADLALFPGCFTLSAQGLMFSMYVEKVQYRKWPFPLKSGLLVPVCSLSVSSCQAVALSDSLFPTRTNLLPLSSPMTQEFSAEITPQISS